VKVSYASIFITLADTGQYGLSPASVTILPKSNTDNKIPIKDQKSNRIRGVQSGLYNEPEDILVSLKYNGIINNIIPSILFKKVLYVPFKEMMDNLKIPVKKDSNGYSTESADIFNVKLDIKNMILVVNASKIRLDQDNTIIRDDEIFIRKDIYETGFHAELNFNFPDLTLNLYSSKYFPVYSSYLREQNYKYIKSNIATKEYPLMFPANNNLIDGAVLDYSLGSYYSNRQNPFYHYQFALGGQVLGGEARIDMTGQYSNSAFLMYDHNYYWNYPVNNKYLTKITVGDQYVQGLNFYQGEGVTLSNEPLSQRYLFNDIKFSGATYPNSIVELYINEKLADFQRTGESGNYIFNMPLGYGTTLLKTISYGNNGEITESRSLSQVTSNLLPSGEINYSVFAGTYGKTTNSASLGHIAYGINEWLTAKSGFEYLKNDYSNKIAFQQNLYARIFSNCIVDLTAVPDNQYGLDMQTTFNDLSTFYLSYYNFERNAFYNQTNIKNNITGGIFLPLQSTKTFYKYFPINISMEGRYTELESLNSGDFKFVAGSNIGSFYPFVSVRTNYLENILTTTTYSAGIYYSFASLFNMLNGNIVSAKFDFNSSPGRFNYGYITYAADLFKNIRGQLILSDNFDGRGTDIQFQLISDLPFTRSTTSLADNLFSEGIQGSITNSGIKLNFYNRNNAGKGAVTFIVFADKNGNGIYDNGEETLQNVRLLVNGTDISQNDANGVFNLYELDAYNLYKVTIDESKVKNPLLKPDFKDFSFYAEPNITKQILIPFYTSGEITGFVSNSLEKLSTGLAGIKIIIKSKDGEIFNTQTFADGSYYFFGLKPGAYEIYPDPNQMSKLSKRIVPPYYNIKISINESGDSIDNLDFKLN
jgi:hypothetical protein